jgi:hypothetical protein
VDLNGDGRMDLVSGEYSPGNIHFFEGTRGGFKASKPLAEEGADFKDMNRWMSTVHFADWDGDKDLDMVVGSVMGGVYLNVNKGTRTKPVFGKREPIMVGGSPMKVKGKSDPFVADWDGDGKPDLLVGDEYAQVTFFKGLGRGSFEPGVLLGPETAAPDETLKKHNPTGKPILPGYRLRIHVTDWNGDGKLDLLAGNCFADGGKTSGNVYLFLRQ